MIQINVVPPIELCSQHLLEEIADVISLSHRIATGKLKNFYADAPKVYTAGTGHTKFFVDKGYFLIQRYAALNLEGRQRGLATYYVPLMDSVKVLQFLNAWKDYTVTPEAIEANRKRIISRMPSHPRWAHRTPPDWISS